MPDCRRLSLAAALPWGSFPRTPEIWWPMTRRPRGQALLAFCAVFLVACGASDDDCGLWLTEACLDADGDGYRWAGDEPDCDDDDAAVHPGLPCYCDADSDGRGQANVTQTACDCATLAVGEDTVCSAGAWVRDPTDCDDTDPDVGVPTLWPDADGDGFGTTEDGAPGPIEACSAAGFVDNADDCNDSPVHGGAAINPGALEICDDELDNNCSGDADEIWCVYEVQAGDQASGARQLVGESESDHFGKAVANVGDFDGIAGHELAVGARLRDGAAGNNSGALYVFSEDTVDPADALVWYGAAANEELGWAVSAVVDFNGDGWIDLAAGSPKAESITGEVVGGRGYVLPGADDLALRSEQALQEVAFTLEGPEPGALMGATIASGDFNGDGCSDVLFGAPLGDVPQDLGNYGAVYLLFGHAFPASEAGELSASAGWDDPDPLVHHFYGFDKTEHAGQGLAAVDHNGDGIQDILVGAPFADRSQADTGLPLLDELQSGSVHMVLGWDTGDPLPSTLLEDADKRWRGYGFKAYAGYALAAVGDLDGDGTHDFVVGAPQASNLDDRYQAGRVYFVLSNWRADTPGDGDLELEDYPRFEGTQIEQLLGHSLAGAGWIDPDDTFPSVLIGGEEVDDGVVAPVGDAGAMFLVRGRDIAPDTLLLEPNATVLGAKEGSALGNSVTGALDWGPSGFVATGASLESFADLGTSPGAVYLLPADLLLACNERVEPEGYAHPCVAQ